MKCAIRPWGALGDEDRSAWHVEYRRDVLKQLRIPMDKPWNKLTAKQKQLVLHGTDKRVKVNWTTKNGEGTFNTKFDGVINWLERTLRETGSERRKTALAAYYSTHTCSVCGGNRISPVSAAVRVDDETLPSVCNMTIGQAREFFTQLTLTGGQAQIASGVLREVQARLRFLGNVGLDYLSLNRSGPTLSGGEAQRIRLASQIGSRAHGRVVRTR